MWEREMLVKMEDAVAGEIYVPGVTIKMSKTPGRVGPVPTPGQHTDEVLRRCSAMTAANSANCVSPASSHSRAVHKCSPYPGCRFSKT